VAIFSMYEAVSESIEVFLRKKSIKELCDHNDIRSWDVERKTSVKDNRCFIINLPSAHALCDLDLHSMHHSCG